MPHRNPIASGAQYAVKRHGRHIQFGAGLRLGNAFDQSIHHRIADARYIQPAFCFRRFRAINLAKPIPRRQRAAAVEGDDIKVEGFDARLILRGIHQSHGGLNAQTA